MKKLLAEINDTFRQNSWGYLIVILFLCIGIVFGICMVKYMNKTDKNDLVNYFNIFIENTRNESTDYSKLLLSVVIKILLIVVPIILLGFTFFGTPFILTLNFVKGFTLGYSFSFLFNAIETKGVLLAIACTIPQNIFYLPCIIFISMFSIKNANLRFVSRFIKNKNLSLQVYDFKKSIFTIALLLIFGIVIETFICPSIIKLIV